MNSKLPKVLIIAGPTASGKKGISLDIAEQFSGEIMSADSRKVYRGLDIGIAKPSPESRKRVPHHLIDVADIGQPFSAGDWVEMASEAVSDIISRGKLPIISGGTGFYIRAFTDGLSAGIDPSPGVREELDRELAELGPGGLHRLLEETDPARAAELPENDTFRVMRALEIYRTTGMTFTELREEQPPRGHSCNYLRIGITRQQSELYRRCDTRVDAMIAADLEQEVRAILARGVPRDTQALDTVGYHEWFSYLDGGQTREETIVLIKQNTRRYAKRQLTWFAAQPGFAWYNPDIPGTVNRIETDIRAWLEKD